MDLEKITIKLKINKLLNQIQKLNIYLNYGLFLLNHYLLFIHGQNQLF